ncbi:reverse transcriptase domain-containing protein [Tanacetum coccineum]
MPVGLCNAPGMFQGCMMAIFHDMIEKTMEVFMDDFSVFGNSFSTCLSNLERMLKRCEDTNLALNWEKSHFMVKEGIVLGHKISKKGIEFDKAKIDIIAKLPHPTTVKGIRSFLEHTLKKKLTEAPILIAPDWDHPFELMYDASNYAIGAVLGAEYFSIKSAVCRSRILRRASSCFVPLYLTTTVGTWVWIEPKTSADVRDVVIVVASVLIGGGVTSDDGLVDETSVNGAITGGVDYYCLMLG